MNSVNAIDEPAHRGCKCNLAAGAKQGVLSINNANNTNNTKSTISSVYSTNSLATTPTSSSLNNYNAFNTTQKETPYNIPYQR